MKRWIEQVGDRRNHRPRGVTGFLSVELEMAIHQRGHCPLTSPPGDLRFFSTSSKSNPTNSISLHFWEDSAGSRGLGVAGVVARDIDSDGTFCCHHHPNWQAQDAPSQLPQNPRKRNNSVPAPPATCPRPSRTNPGG